MKLSMDGLRRNSTHDFNEFSNFLKSILDDIACDVDTDQLIELHDQVAQNLGTLNCVFDEENELFNDLSEKLEVNFLGEDDED